MRSAESERPSGILGATYEAIARTVTALGEDDFTAPTRCAGWTVADLLFHMLLDAQRALVTFASPASAAADVDAVTYWRGVRSGPDTSRAHARFVRIAASAYSRPDSLVAHWCDTAAAAVRAARVCGGADAVTTQGHVLDVDDFVVTLIVEAAVHHLDLTERLAHAAPVPPEALQLVRRTLDGLLGQAVPLDWDNETYALKGTGRVALTDEERGALGPGAARFPLLG